MKKINLNISFAEYFSEDELDPVDRNLVQKAKAICTNAYAPYSKFSVGAAALLANGQIIIGTNQENAAFPSGLCAERVAVFYANSKFPDIPIKTIAIAAYKGNSFLDRPISPCGACRQVLMETEVRFKHPLRLILFGNDKIVISENMTNLLPLNFDDTFL